MSVERWNSIKYLETYLIWKLASYPFPIPEVNVSFIAIYGSLIKRKTLEHIQIWKGMNFTNEKLRKDGQ